MNLVCQSFALPVLAAGFMVLIHSLRVKLPEHDNAESVFKFLSYNGSNLEFVLQHFDIEKSEYLHLYIHFCLLMQKMILNGHFHPVLSLSVALLWFMVSHSGSYLWVFITSGFFLRHM